MRGHRQPQHDQPQRHPGAVRSRVGAGDRPGEEAPAGQEVQQHQAVQPRVGQGGPVERGQVQQVEPAGREQQAGDRVGRHPRDRVAQHPQRRPADVATYRAQREGAGRAEHQPERRQHPDQQVPPHVPDQVVAGQHRGHREQRGARTEARGTPVAPAAAPRVALAQRRGQVDPEDQQRYEQQRADPVAVLPDHRRSAQVSTVAARRCTAQPTAISAAPNSRKPTSQAVWWGPPCT